MKFLKTSLLSVLLATALPIHADVLVGFTGNKDGTTAQDIALSAIRRASKSIDLAAYQLTKGPVLDAVVSAATEGIKVRVLLDKTQEHGDAATALALLSVECRVDHAHKIMHHKFMVIDHKTVETGSFNYSKSASTVNAENALLLVDMPDVANIYTVEFEKQFKNPKTTPCQQAK